MSNHSDVPEVVIKAFRYLRESGIAKITRPLQYSNGDKSQEFCFECLISVPHPNKENIPSEVALLVVIPESFPHSFVYFIPKSEEISGFPHQPGGPLCLEDKRKAPSDYRCLLYYVERAKKWLADAAMGTLTKPGEPYELPDFAPSQNLQLLFSEDETSFAVWQNHIGSSGKVECFLGIHPQTAFTQRFFDENKQVLWETRYSEQIQRGSMKFGADWVLFPNIFYHRYRPPKLYSEMMEFCERNGVDFSEIGEKASVSQNRALKLLLVGFPIPQKYGEKNSEIHWQPLFLETKEDFSETSSGLLVPLYLSKMGLIWGRSKNISRSRLYKRGSYRNSMQSQSFTVFGCGAIGSLIAELLARGGVEKLSLFDPDIVSFGNLCRHTLAGMDVGLNKARALAQKLSLTCPLSTIQGYPCSIPLRSSTIEEIWQEVEATDIFVDCTTDEHASNWLSDYAGKHNKRMISLFFNLHARILTLYISGAKTPGQEIAEDITRCVKDRQTPIDPEEYLYEPQQEDEIFEGAGCWESTFPALNVHIQSLTAAALDVINAHLSKNDEKGLAVIIERTSPDQQIVPNALIKIAWVKEYP